MEQLNALVILEKLKSIEKKLPVKFDDAVLQLELQNVSDKLAEQNELLKTIADLLEDIRDKD